MQALNWVDMKVGDWNADGNLETGVEDCDDAWNEYVAASVTSTADNVDKKVGTGSARITDDGGLGVDAIFATEAIAPANLSGYSGLEFWIKSSVTVADDDLQILLFGHAESETVNPLQFTCTEQMIDSDGGFTLSTANTPTGLQQP